MSTKRKSKRLIPKTHCIELLSWRDPDHKNLHVWKERRPGMSTSSTGAGSLSDMVKKLRQNLKAGYTHFVASYPVAMQGPMTAGNPHGRTFGNRLQPHDWIPIVDGAPLPGDVMIAVLRKGTEAKVVWKIAPVWPPTTKGWTHYYPLPPF